MRKERDDLFSDAEYEQEQILDDLYRVFVAGEEGDMSTAYYTWMDSPDIFGYHEAAKRLDFIFMYEDEVPDLGEWWQLYDALAEYVYQYDSSEGLQRRRASKGGNMRKSIDRIRRRQNRMRKAALADSELKGYSIEFEDEVDALARKIEDMHDSFNAIFMGEVENWDDVDFQFNEVSDSVEKLLHAVGRVVVEMVDRSPERY